MRPEPLCRSRAHGIRLSPNPTRRSLLATGRVAAAGGVAGCADLDGAEELAHEVEAYNRRDTGYTRSVRVEAAAGDALYHRTFEIEADRAREGTDPFTGTPAAVVVTIDDRAPIDDREPIDDRAPIEREWPDPNSEQQETRSAGGVDVFPLPDGEV